MRFIKRFLFILLLLVIAFFVYSWISPNSAKSLLTDLKSFSNTSFGTDFNLSGDTTETTGVVLNVTGLFLDTTGTVLSTTGTETTGDELLLNDVDVSTETVSTPPLSGAVTSTGTSAVTTPSTTKAPVVAPKPLPTKPSVPVKKTTTSQSSSDYQKLLENFNN